MNALTQPATRGRSIPSNAAPLRQVTNLARRGARALFAPKLTMAVVAVGALGSYAAAVAGDDKTTAALALAALPGLMAALYQRPAVKPSDRKGGER